MKPRSLGWNNVFGFAMQLVLNDYVVSCARSTDRQLVARALGDPSKVLPRSPSVGGHKYDLEQGSVTSDQRLIIRPGLEVRLMDGDWPAGDSRSIV